MNTAPARTTTVYLDALKAHLNLSSDYALAEVLGVCKQTVSSYRMKGIAMDDEIAKRAADLLDIAPATVLIDMYAQRTRNPAIKEVWHHIGQTYQAHAQHA